MPRLDISDAKLTIRIPDAAVRKSGVAPAPMKGVPVFVTVSPQRKHKYTLEEEFKQSERTQIKAQSCASRAPVETSRDDAPVETSRNDIIMPSSRVAVLMNVGLGHRVKPSQIPRHREAIVTAVNSVDKTADVVYTDGENSYSVPLEFVKLIEVHTCEFLASFQSITMVHDVSLNRTWRVRNSQGHQK
jgi:hypothetical protein